jgi:hypothetical protein
MSIDARINYAHYNEREVMEMKDNQYYENLVDEIKNEIKKADGFVQEAEKLRAIRKRIKNRKGIFRIVDKMIFWEIVRYYKMANRIYIKYFNGCIEEMNYLENLLKR